MAAAGRPQGWAGRSEGVGKSLNLPQSGLRLFTLERHQETGRLQVSAASRSGRNGVEGPSFSGGSPCLCSARTMHDDGSTLPCCQSITVRSAHSSPSSSRAWASHEMVDPIRRCIRSSDGASILSSRFAKKGSFSVATTLGSHLVPAQ